MRCNAYFLRGTGDILPFKFSYFSCTTPSCSCPGDHFYDLWRNKLTEKNSCVVQTCAMPLAFIASPWFFLMMSKTTHKRAWVWASATILQLNWWCQSSWPLSNSPPLDSNQNAVVRHQFQLNQLKLRQLGLQLLFWYVFQTSLSGFCEGSVNLYTNITERGVEPRNMPVVKVAHGGKMMYVILSEWACKQQSHIQEATKLQSIIKKCCKLHP